MDSPNEPSKSDQDSGTPVDQGEALNELIKQRRKELGISESSPPPVQITKAMPARELMPEQIASREADMQRMALAEQRSRRQGMFASFAEKVGSRYSGCRLKNFVCENERQQAAVDACREYADTIVERLADANGLVLYGPVGTGKDHLAFGVCGAAIINHGRSAGWLSGQDWFGEIRDQMGEDANTSERLLIARLVSPEILVISDPLPPIGSLSQHQSTMLYRLVDARYHAGRLTIVTANVKDDAEADSRLGAPTWDRICDKAWKVHCNWPSFRKPAKIVNSR